MRNAASLWWETALLSLGGVVLATSANRSKGEGGAASLVGCYKERWKPGDMMASPVPPDALQRACFGRFTYGLLPYLVSAGAYGGLLRARWRANPLGLANPKFRTWESTRRGSEGYPGR